MPSTTPKTGAFVTLVTNADYGMGAAVLGQRLRDFKTRFNTVVMVTASVPEATRQLLSKVWDEVLSISELNSNDTASLALLQRPELGVTFTKLHVWKLTEYKKVVFLDSDTMPLCNIDDLFLYNELSACPDAGWPDCFNTGLFVLTPDVETYDGLVKMAADEGTFDGGDQGLLNSYFSSWAHGDIKKHIPFVYNVNPNASYTYLPAYRRFSKDVKNIHFLGSSKPWHYECQDGAIIGANVSQHLRGFLEQWHASLNKALIEEAAAEPEFIQFCSTGGSISGGESVVSVLSHIAGQIKDKDTQREKVKTGQL